MTDEQNTSTLAPLEDQAGAPGQKPAGKKAIWLAVAAVVVVAAVVLGKGLLGPSDPKEIVSQAVYKTLQQQQEQYDKLIQGSAPLKLAGQYRTEACASEYDLRLNGVSGFEGSQLINQMVAGAGIRGTATQDLQGGAMSIEATVDWMSTDLFTGYLEVGPERMAMGLPSASDTYLAVYPQALDEQAAASPFFQLTGIEPEMLQAMQSQLQSQLQLMQDPQKLSSDLLDGMGAVVSAQMQQVEYTAGQKDQNGSTPYTAVIPGAQAKAMVVGLLDYLMADSPLRPYYEDAMALQQELMGAESYDALVQMVTDELSAQLPEADVSIEMVVNGQGLLDSMAFSMVIPESLQEVLSECSGRMTFGGEGAYELKVLGAEGTGLVLQLTGNYQLSDQIYQVDMAFELLADEEGVTLTLSQLLDATNPQVQYGLTMDMGMDMGYTPMNIGLTVDGTLEAQDQTLTVAADTLQLQLQDDTMAAVVDLGFTETTVPLADAPQVQREYVDVTTLDAQQLQAILAEYEQGLYSVFGQLGLY